jgi:hypothetical protein
MMKNEMGGACSKHGEVYMYTEFCWENLREKDLLDDLVIGGCVILKWIFKKWVGVWIVFIWLKIWTGKKLL